MNQTDLSTDKSKHQVVIEEEELKGIVTRFQKIEDRRLAPLVIPSSSYIHQGHGRPGTNNKNKSWR